MRCCLTCRLKGHGSGLCHPAQEVDGCVQEVDGCVPLRRASRPVQEVDSETTCRPCRLEGHGHGLCRPVPEVDRSVPLRRLGRPVWMVDGELREAAH